MVDAPKKSCPQGCGVNGKPCGDPECYPVCGFRTREEGVEYVEFVIRDDGTGKPSIHELNEKELKTLELNKSLPPGQRLPVERDDPKTPNKNESEIDTFTYFGVPMMKGYGGFCRSEVRDEFVVSRFNTETKEYDIREKVESYRWYLHGDKASHLVFRNKFNGFKHGSFLLNQNIRIKLTAHEMDALARCEELELTDLDELVAMRPNPQKGKQGIYYFVPNSTRIEEIIAKLKEPDIAKKLKAAGLSDKRRLQLIERLNALKDKIEKPIRLQEKAIAVNKESVDRALMWQIIIAFASLAGLGLIFWSLNRRQVKEMRKMHEESMERMEKMNEKNMKMMMGDQEVKIEDFTRDLVEEQRKLLEENRQLNEIIGRDQEALRYLQHLRRPEYANPLLVGESGAGKDKVVERAAQLIALKDPRVPRALLGIKILYVSKSAIQAGTGLRGSVSSRHQVLIKAMLEGRDAIYVPELHEILSAGSSSEGRHESFAADFKDVLDKQKSRVSGSTTNEGYNMMTKMFQGGDTSFKRRYPAIDVSEMPASLILEGIREKVAPWYGEHYGVEISAEAVEASVRLGLKYFGELKDWPRYDAAKQALLNGIEYMVMEEVPNGQKIVITAEHIVRGAARALKVPIDPLAVWEDGVERLGPEGGVSVFKGDVGATGGADKVVPENAAAGENIATVEAVADQLKTDPRLEGWFDELGKGDRREIARCYCEAWNSLSPKEREAIIKDSGALRRRGEVPSLFIRSLHAKTSEVLAGRGAKGRIERPEDRERRLRGEEAERKGHERMLKHMFDPKRPRPPGR